MCTVQCYVVSTCVYEMFVSTHVPAVSLQSLFGGDVDNPELRSLSKAETHYDSFNRHFPVARLTSKTAEVQQVRLGSLSKLYSPPFQDCAAIGVLVV